MTLNELNIGESADVLKVGGTGALRQHFLDMGIIPGAEVTLVKLAPMGDPLELRIHDCELTLRIDDAKKIDIALKKNKNKPQKKEEYFEEIKPVGHLGLGQNGIYDESSEAKESVVATLSILLGGIPVSQFITPLAALSLLVFTLLYTPCVAAISAIKREIGAKWAVTVVIGQFAIAWVMAFLVRMLGMLAGMM